MNALFSLSGHTAAPSDAYRVAGAWVVASIIEELES
jgi:hypothetical protein